MAENQKVLKFSFFTQEVADAFYDYVMKHYRVKTSFRPRKLEVCVVCKLSPQFDLILKEDLREVFSDLNTKTFRFDSDIQGRAFFSFIGGYFPNITVEHHKKDAQLKDGTISRVDDEKVVIVHDTYDAIVSERLWRVVDKYFQLLKLC